MATLYNCHHDGDQYRITKFNELGEPESSYLCTETECECPAGVRPSCRHRQMLPKFLAREAVDSFWFYDFERGGWVTNEPNGQMNSYFKQADEPAIAPEGLTVDTDLIIRVIDPTSPKVLPPGYSIRTMTTKEVVDTYGADAVPDDYGEDPIGLESLPPVRPAWRRI